MFQWVIFHFVVMTKRGREEGGKKKKKKKKPVNRVTHNNQRGKERGNSYYGTDCGLQGEILQRPNFYEGRKTKAVRGELGYIKLWF